MKDELIGDGVVVPLRKALGQHDEAPHLLNFEPDNQSTADGAIHTALLSRPDVGA